MENTTVHVIRNHEGETNTLGELITVNDIIVPNEMLVYFLLVNLWGPGFLVCIFGIVANILNIITFIKQGVRDTVNISLLGLATSDLGSQITLLYTSISFFTAFSALCLPFMVYDVMYICAWCHILFTRITTLITAYITLERCMCVTAPLKVRNIFTAKRTILYICLVYAIMTASVSPCFSTVQSALVFVPARNTSLIGLSFMENRNYIENITFTTNNAIPTASFFLVVGCTSVLVSHLRKKSKWRQRATTSSIASAVSDRDSKVVKMVVLISVIFITCYLPGTAMFILMIVNTEIRFDGQQANLMYAIFSVLFHLESINAGVNIFIYLSLSSKFKATFMRTFCLRTKKTPR